MPTPSETASLEPIDSPPLADLQRWLRWILTDPRGVDRALAGGDSPVLASNPRGREPSPRLLGLLADAPPLSATQRLDVYSGAYFARLLESLAADFRGVRRVLGEARFRELIANYLAVHPSTAATINLAGEHLPEHLRLHPVSGALDFLADLARLEWEALLSLFADRLPPLDQEALGRATPETLAAARLGLDPTVRLLRTDWPVDGIWRQRDLPEDRTLSLPKRRRKRKLLVFRDASWVQIRALTEAQSTALQAIQAGASLAKVCQDVQDLRHRAGTPRQVQSWFGDWITSGVIKTVEFNHGNP